MYYKYIQNIKHKHLCKHKQHKQHKQNKPTCIKMDYLYLDVIYVYKTM